MRALGVCNASGKPFSFFRKKNTRQRPFEIHYFWLGWPRKKLYDRIEKRVDKMLEQGWVEEVKNLLEFKQYTSLNTVGYKEIIAYLEGKLEWEEMKNEIKIQTRRYAKRQYTWMRRDGFWTTLYPLDFEFIPLYLKSKVVFKQYSISESESEYFYLENEVKKISVVAKKGKNKTVLNINEMNADIAIQLLFCSFLAGDLYFEEYCGEVPELWRNYLNDIGFKKIKI
jgi:tRNA A37 N6-isopentenylltransferase MiaA